MVSKGLNFLILLNLNLLLIEQSSRLVGTYGTVPVVGRVPIVYRNVGTGYHLPYIQYGTYTYVGR